MLVALESVELVTELVGFAEEVVAILVDSVELEFAELGTLAVALREA